MEYDPTEYETTGEYRKPVPHEYFAAWSHIDHLGTDRAMRERVIQAGSQGVSSERIIMQKHTHKFVCKCGEEEIPW